MKDNRYRNFASIVYPESAPDDWIEKLKEYHVPFFISPLHDRDIDFEGKPKKEHFHCMIMYSGKKSHESASELFSSIGGVGCVVINDKISYARYLIHMDDPEKAQYSSNDVISGCGANYEEIILDANSIEAEYCNMIEFIQSNNVLDFCDLVEYSNVNNRRWAYILSKKGSFYMKSYIDSRWKKFMRLNEKRLRDAD